MLLPTASPPEAGQPTSGAAGHADREERFIAFLAGLADKEDRGALAALRRGLGRRPGEVADPCRYVEPFLADDADNWTQAAYYTVAALFATHPVNWRRKPDDADRGPTNLGASFDRMTSATDSGRASVDRRFTALLNCDSEDLATHLRHAIGLLKGKEIPVDWAQLLRDVRWWGHPNRRVQRAWARAFWRQAQHVPAETNATSKQESN